MIDLIGPPCPYRAAGYTWEAGLYPHTPAGIAIIAQHNGTTPDKLPRGARYAANPGMFAWIEGLGARLIAGLPVKHKNGRWLTKSEINEEVENEA